MDPEIKKLLLEIINACPDTQFVTIRPDGYPETRHVMNTLNIGTTDLNLHFMTSNKSHKYDQILRNANICLYYFDHNTRHAIRLFGQILPVESAEQKQKYWKDEYTAYGYINADDPKLALLRFVPKMYKFYTGLEEKSGKI